MNSATHTPVSATSYDRSACQVGVVHLGFGAFHRAHQAVYLDDYMDITGDLAWGIAAVNLRKTETSQFNDAKLDIERHDGYFLKSHAANGLVSLRRVRSHVRFADWSIETDMAEELLAAPSVHLVTITVTESGYYTDPNGALNTTEPTITSEINGETSKSVYAYLRGALRRRMKSTGNPLTIACCDNIRQNGKMLKRNLSAYLSAFGDVELARWVDGNVAFPCSMVDRITPRSPRELSVEMSALIGQTVKSPIMAEDFSQWVLQSKFAAKMPDLARAGVTVTAEVDPYEETKIRVLNGGHTALAYFAALKGVETFDAAMRDPDLYHHFRAFEAEEVLPALRLNLPFSKTEYLDSIDRRFGNRAIGDTVARICADGMAKFQIFIRPTLEGCLEQRILPNHAIRSIAAWFVFARHVQAGKISFEYVEPNWGDLSALLNSDAFVTSGHLWGDLPRRFPEFSETLRLEITELEMKWPV